ncbi:MAG: prepilin-type N-terminal cleavage/methylation domain-containing protein [Rubrivivax sp.]|nr:prepilin-type N-terminal cleavage/methylation domain-containing protein [Rubrivivax sp.]
MTRRRLSPALRQRGLSLVEMMVGVAVGLFVVAAAAMLVATQLSDNRRLLLETQVQQDLRASLDIVTRELRRAGALTAEVAQVGLASGGAGGQTNAFGAVTPTDANASETGFSYMRMAGEEGPYGFKLEGGAIKTRLGGAGWQELTDPNTLRITEFTVTAQNAAPIQLPCPRLCADGGTGCWPTVVVREFVVQVTGQAVGDAAVRRSLRSTVRLRNDWVRFNDAANPIAACPA